MSTNIKRNFIYNIIYQILIMIVPLITAPYVSRVLGVDGVGTYSYTQTIANYFVLFSMLGMNNYGNRSIAQVNHNKIERSRRFWNIYGMQFIISSIIMLIYIVYCLFIVKEYKQISLLQSIYIFSAILDINWFYFGMEKFKLTITRNAIVKIGTVLGVFIFVHDVEGLSMYTIVCSLSILISNLLLWIPLRKYICWKKPTFKDIFLNLKPLFILFIPVVAISLYKMMDKVMIGSYYYASEVGYYTNAEKLVNLPNNVIIALGVVMLPRMSNLVAQKDTENNNKYINLSLLFISFLAPLMAFGLAAIAPELSIAFYGQEFKICGSLISILAVTVIPASIGTVIRSQYLIPNNKDMLYIIAVVCGAAINFCANLLLIPRFGAIGAVYGTIIAETTVAIVEIIGTKNIINYGTFFMDLLIFSVIGSLMFALIRLLSETRLGEWNFIILSIILGGSVYCIASLIYYKVRTKQSFNTVIIDIFHLLKI